MELLLLGLLGLIAISGQSDTEPEDKPEELTEEEKEECGIVLEKSILYKRTDLWTPRMKLKLTPYDKDSFSDS